MHYLGIDWAKSKHDLCLLAEDGRILSQFEITHDMKGFNRLHAVLEHLDDVCINIERSDGLLVDWIMNQGYDLFITPPHVLAHRRPTRAKDDKGDAYLLAHLLRLQDPDCRPCNHQSQIVTHLKQLITAYDHALKEQQRLANQLTHILQQYYPVALTLFSQVYGLISIAFLEAFPTPQQAHALSYEQLEAFLRSQSYRHMTRLDLLYSRLQQAMPQATVQDGYIEYLQLLLPLMRMLFNRKRDLIKEITRVFRSHPDADWILSFPGTRGPLTPARLLAWIGDDRRRFPTAKSLQAVAGTVPITRRSGKRTSVHFRRNCSHPLRSAVDDFARQSLRHSGWAAAYLQEQLDRGHKTNRAYRALANRWMKIYWTLWQNGEFYCEETHIANRSRRGKPIELAEAV